MRRWGVETSHWEGKIICSGTIRSINTHQSHRGTETRRVSQYEALVWTDFRWNEFSHTDWTILPHQRPFSSPWLFIYTERLDCVSSDHNHGVKQMKRGVTSPVVPPRRLTAHTDFNSPPLLPSECPDRAEWQPAWIRTFTTRCQQWLSHSWAKHNGNPWLRRLTAPEQKNQLDPSSNVQHQNKHFTTRSYKCFTVKALLSFCPLKR